MNHGLKQQANDWITCKCGKLFSSSKKGHVPAGYKFAQHMKEVRTNKNEALK